MFEDRQEAGELLAKKLKSFLGKENALVLAIPRGGVAVAKEVSDKLKLPLGLIVVRKIGAPFNPELAIGAVGPQKAAYWDSDLCRELGIDEATKREKLKIKNEEQKQLEKILRGNTPYPEIKDKTVFLIDDGVATGASVLAAAEFLRKEKAYKIILAIPVISNDTLNSISKYFDRIVSLKIAKSFFAVGEFYKSFPQVTNEEVTNLLSKL